jgi:hypothetical protein
MKKIALLAFAAVTLSGFTGCKKEKEEAKKVASEARHNTRKVAHNAEQKANEIKHQGKELLES